MNSANLSAQDEAVRVNISASSDIAAGPAPWISHAPHEMVSSRNLVPLVREFDRQALGKEIPTVAPFSNVPPASEHLAKHSATQPGSSSTKKDIYLGAQNEAAAIMQPTSSDINGRDTLKTHAPVAHVSE